jgi:hypothetical protein
MPTSRKNPQLLREIAVCIMAIAVLLAAARGASAASLGFLSRSAEGKFTDEDVRILQATALSLLSGGVLGQSQDWSNPNSTAHGTLTIVKVFQSAEGFSCKSLRVENRASGLLNRLTFPVCEIRPGDWKIHVQARPETKP